MTRVWENDGGKSQQGDGELSVKNRRMLAVVSANVLTIGVMTDNNVQEGVDDGLGNESATGVPNMMMIIRRVLSMRGWSYGLVEHRIH